jgi:hypothetical protein
VKNTARLFHAPVRSPVGAKLNTHPDPSLCGSGVGATYGCNFELVPIGLKPTGNPKPALELPSLVSGKGEGIGRNIFLLMSGI